MPKYILPKTRAEEKNAPQPDVKSHNDVIVANCESLNVRSEPCVADNIKNIVYKNTELAVEYVNPEWAMIVGPPGFSGYVMRSFLKEKNDG